MEHAQSSEKTVSLRELRNHTSSVLHNVENGESVCITVNKRPVAKLVPLPQRPQWVSGKYAGEKLNGALADPALAQELDELLPQTTDDL